MRVLDHMLDIYSEVRELNENLLALVLVNRVSPNPFLAKELQNLREYIDEAKNDRNLSDLVLMDSVIYERQAYKKAVIEGKSMKEFCKNGDKAIADFEEFYSELLSAAEKRF